MDSILLLNTFWHDWTCLVTICNENLNIISFDINTVSKRFLMQINTISQYLTILSSGVDFYCWTRFYTNGYA
jgi:hypothetical protein